LTLLKTFVLKTDNDAQGLWGFLKSNWRALAEANTPLAVTVADYKAIRSKEQNAQYWRWLSQIAENGWYKGKQYTKDDWHRGFGELFLPKRDSPLGPARPVSTSELKVSEFSAYLDEVAKWAAENLGVVIE
jgi:hypothetical protein